MLPLLAFLEEKLQGQIFYFTMVDIWVCYLYHCCSVRRLQIVRYGGMHETPIRYPVRHLLRFIRLVEQLPQLALSIKDIHHRICS